MPAVTGQGNAEGLPKHFRHRELLDSVGVAQRVVCIRRGCRQYWSASRCSLRAWGSNLRRVVLSKEEFRAIRSVRRQRANEDRRAHRAAISEQSAKGKEERQKRRPGL